MQKREVCAGTHFGPVSLEEEAEEALPGGCIPSRAPCPPGARLPSPSSARLPSSLPVRLW